MKSLEDKVDLLYERMSKRRISHSSPLFDKYAVIHPRGGKINIKNIIKDILSKYKKVTSGYLCTGVKNYHERVLLYK